MNDDKTRLSVFEMQAFAHMYGRDCRVVRWAFAYRRLRNEIWWQWRRRVLSWFKKGPPKDGRLHVYWHLRGGIGDCAAARMAVMALRQRLPDAVFYFHTHLPGAASALFEENERNVLLPAGVPLWGKYDLAFETCLSFKTAHADRGRIAALAPDFLPVLDKMTARQNEFSFFLKDNYLMEDLLGRWMLRSGLKRGDLFSYLSGTDFDPYCFAPALPEALTDAVRLDAFGLRGKKYVTLHDGIDVTFSLGGKQPLKCWPKENWRELAALLKKQYPGVLLVQLGGKNSAVFDFVDVSLVGKTRVSDLPALLNASLLHIDGESGLVQMSRYLENVCLTLFGPTDKAFYGLGKNVNLKEAFCGSCMWLLGAQWHTRCALGYHSCRNMDALTPDKVFAAAKEILDVKLK